jgi:hypothetical protein
MEEINLICIYHTMGSSRDALCDTLALALDDVYDSEMLLVFDSTIQKLEAITDEEFDELCIYISDVYLEEGAFAFGE